MPRANIQAESTYHSAGSKRLEGISWLACFSYIPWNQLDEKQTHTRTFADLSLKRWCADGLELAFSAWVQHGSSIWAETVRNPWRFSRTIRVLGCVELDQFSISIDNTRHTPYIRMLQYSIWQIYHSICSRVPSVLMWLGMNEHARSNDLPHWFRYPMGIHPAQVWIVARHKHDERHDI